MMEPSLMEDYENIRSALIKALEKVLARVRESRLGEGIDSEDISLGRQALEFLQSNRPSRIDANRHFNILLRVEVLTANEVSHHAKLILKYITQE